VVECEVEAGEVERPSGLPPIQLLSCHEVLQVLVVHPDLALMFRALDKVLPLLEGSDDRQHLLVVDLIVPLDGGQGLGEERDWVPLFVFRGYLGEDCTRCKVGAVGFDAEGFGRVGRDEDWSRSDTSLQPSKCGALSFSPAPTRIVSGQVEEQAGVFQEVSDEPLVEVGESEEGLHFCKGNPSRFPFRFRSQLAPCTYCSQPTIAPDPPSASATLACHVTWYLTRTDTYLPVSVLFIISVTLYISPYPQGILILSSSDPLLGMFMFRLVLHNNLNIFGSPASTTFRSTSRPTAVALTAPWVIQYPHLAAILRMRDNHNDPLSVMWWDPTCDDFQSSDSSLVAGLGFLVRSKFYEFEVKMRHLEDRIEEYKKTTMKPNTLLLLLERVMHDSCVRLGSLKTTFTEMRFGVADFQRNYVEVYALLDYLELYKP